VTHDKVAAALKLARHLIKVGNVLNDCEAKDVRRVAESVWRVVSYDLTNALSEMRKP
jgi:hypothetical protein